jgi:uncharacterized protein YyaL (SSP411 family)
MTDSPARVKKVFAIGLAMLCCVGGRAQESLEPKSMTTPKPAHAPNHLIHEQSPYLQQHAYNPVDWYPWGEEAFAKARRENKPIFLSIGYSTCHWCHVMEHESFENETIAKVLNDNFVAIKVDREERPDLDKIYMTATQATTGSGGWPMSVWLTQELKPFYCGTYFPPESRYGRPGFKELLLKIHDVWEANHTGIVAQANQITQSIEQYVVAGRDESSNWTPDDTPLKVCFAQMQGSYDAENGGFGGAPKFPRPVALNFLLQYYSRTGNTEARDMVLHTLRKMGEGGMFDQLGGGFHRYSVDDHWLVSHFEKMLYDQAQLVSSYIDAYQITHDLFYADIARRTCDYVLREMTNGGGAFYSAEDADSEGVEGKFYVWTQAEIESVLGEKAKAFDEAYGVTAVGNWEHGLNVLHIVDRAAASFGPEREKLFVTRAKRIRPHRDEKILTSWNGLMISALCRAAQALNEPRYQAAAQRAARYILTEHFKTGKLTRSATVPAVVDDYAAFGLALVDLYETDFDPDWLQMSIELTDAMIKQFYDAKDGGFYMNGGVDPNIIVRAKEDYDGAEPSGNSLATMLLLRLAQYTDREDYRQAAEHTLTLFANRLRNAPHIMPQMLCALDFNLSKTKHIVLAGNDTGKMLQAVRERYLPNKIVLVADSEGKLARLLPFVKDMKPIGGKATAYVCVNHTCQLPTSDLGKLKELLDAR